MVYKDGKEVFISNPTEFPDMTNTAGRIQEVQEPIIKASIIVPDGRSVNGYTCKANSIGRVFRRSSGSLLQPAR